MSEGTSSDLVGRGWFAMVGGGFASGLLASVALAGPLYLVLPSSYVAGWGAAPSLVGSLGYVAAALLGVGGGVLAGLPSARPLTAGATAGAGAGSIVYATIAAPALALMTAAPFWQGVALPHDEVQGTVLLATALVVTLTAQWLGCVLLIAAFLALGALGGAIATVLQSEPPATTDPSPLAALSSAGTAGPLTTALVAFVVLAALDPLRASIAAKVTDNPIVWLDTFALEVGPAVLYVACYSVCVVLGAFGAQQAVRFQGRGGAGQAWMTAITGVGTALAFTFGATSAAPGSVWPVAGIASVVVSVVAFWLALRKPSPLAGSPAPETPLQSAGAALSDTFAMWNPFTTLALNTGLAAALVIVPCIPAATNEGPMADPLALTTALYATTTEALFGSFVVLAVVMFFAHVLLAQFVKWRQAAAVVQPA